MELHCIPLTDDPDEPKFILLRPLLGLAFIGNRAMADLTQRLALQGREAAIAPAQQPVLEFLERAGFFLPDPPPPPRFSTALTTAVLLLTNRCQLRCSYCYAAGGDRPPEELAVQTGMAVIDAVCAQAQAAGAQRFDVAFHGGGEPTLAWDVLTACTEYAHSRSLPARVTLTSNAVWSPQQLDWIARNLNALSISMDGAPETQDRQRPLRGGGASSPLVLRSLAELDRRGVAYGVRLTTSAPWVQLVEDVRYLCEHTHCTGMQVEPAFNTERGAHCPPVETQAADFAQAFVAAYDLARSFGRELRYSAARPGLVTSRFCNAPYNALIAAPGDRLVACYEITDRQHPLAELSDYGRVVDGVVQVNEAARARLHDLLAERRGSCRECFCYWSCAGDCYTRGFAPGEHGNLEHGVRCDLNRVLTREMLAAMISEAGGVWRAKTLQAAQVFSPGEWLGEG